MSSKEEQYEKLKKYAKQVQTMMSMMKTMEGLKLPAEQSLDIKVTAILAQNMLFRAFMLEMRNEMAGLVDSYITLVEPSLREDDKDEDSLAKASQLPEVVQWKALLKLVEDGSGMPPLEACEDGGDGDATVS